MGQVHVTLTAGGETGCSSRHPPRTHPGVAPRPYRRVGTGQRPVPSAAAAGAQPGAERHERPAEAGLGETEPKLWIKSTPPKRPQTEAHILPSPRRGPKPNTKGPSVQACPTSCPRSQARGSQRCGRTALHRCSLPMTIPPR